MDKLTKLIEDAENGICPDCLAIPSRMIPVLRAFQKMQEALRQIEGPQIHPEGEAMDDTAAVESMTIKAQMALEIADAAIENL